MDVLARQAVVVGPAGAGRPVDLGEDLQRLAPLAGQGLAEHRLGRGVGVDVGGVEGRDAVVEGRAHAGERGVLLDLRAVGEPVAVGDLADLETAGAEVACLHGVDPRRRPDRRPAGRVSSARAASGRA